jgi:hypothetical protein
MAPAAPVVRVYFSGQRMWGGAAAPKRVRRAPKKAPKPLRVALPMGEDTTLARGALVYGMAGAKAEERRRLIEVARELRGGAQGVGGRDRGDDQPGPHPGGRAVPELRQRRR